MYKILSINPGSGSTKIAVYQGEKLKFSNTIRHSSDELLQYKRIFDQYDFRKKLILQTLEKENIALTDFAIVIGRGGLMHPLESGTYEVSDSMVADLKTALGGEHASNLGAVLAREIADSIPNCKAYIADPVIVDELQDVARISGLPQFPRRSTFHALNHKAIGRKYARSVAQNYEELNLVIAHLGGGISVAAHRQGKVIDTNQALDGFGPFSPERAGTMDAGALIRLCFEGKYNLQEIQKMLVGKGGLVAHLGTNDVHEATIRAQNGDKHAELILEAMAYNVGKEIGAMLAVLKGDVDAVILTGGIAYDPFIVGYIRSMIAPIAPVVVYPGEDEMEALAIAGLRILRGEKSKKYV
ncbi:MAG: butyrate kinase [Porphyromonadaceae bacterium CG2_30_38_12]|nr:MAG: butyrate kinase [Porphyromonadaceae bacterium CG2_30_38_12]